MKKKYIDMDKLKKLKKHSIQTEFGAFPRHEYFVKYTDLICLPTADVQEVKHGKWQYNSGWGFGESPYFCCLCGEGTSDYGYDNYCSNCGAKMDLKEDEKNEKENVKIH